MGKNKKNKNTIQNNEQSSLDSFVQGPNDDQQPLESPSSRPHMAEEIKEYDSSQSQVNKKDNQIKDLQKKLDELQQQKNDQVKELQKQVDELKKQKDVTNQQVQRLVKELQTKDQQIATLTQKCELAEGRDIIIDLQDDQILSAISSSRSSCRNQLEALHLIQTGNKIDLKNYKCNDTLDKIDEIFNPIIQVPEPGHNALHHEVHHFLKKIKKIRQNKCSQLLTIYHLVSKYKDEMTETQLEIMISLIQSTLDQLNFVELDELSKVNKDKNAQKLFQLSKIVIKLKESRFKAITGLESNTKNVKEVCQNLGQMIQDESQEFDQLTISNQFEEFMKPLPSKDAPQSKTPKGF